MSALAILISSCSTLKADEQLGVAATCGTTNLAQGKPATASSSENAGYLGAGAAVDGNTGTRWASLPGDPQWLQVDLGSAQTVCGVTLEWEAAYGKAFKVQVTNTPSDPASWATIYETSTGAGGTQVVTPTTTASGRYVRMLGTQRPGGYGYSLFEFKVFGSTDTGGGTGGSTCGTANAALNRPASASSEQSTDTPARAAFDGNPGTRWSSAWREPQVLQVDLGSSQAVCGVTLQWEGAYARSYEIILSDTERYTAEFPSGYIIGGSSVGRGGTEVLDNLDTRFKGRYLRIKFTNRANPDYGVSLFEVQVRTVNGGATPPPPTPPVTLPTSDTPDFGPNVKVYEPGTPGATIQADVDAAFNAQLRSPTAQFGSQRHVFLFKPGSYGRVFANVGFYTTLAGLGKNPDDVTISGAVNVDSGWNLGDEKNATQNFWRSVENLAIIPEGGTNRWAVSQAAPMRRVHIRGNLTLAPSNQDFGQGYSSGGYLSDSKVDGTVSSGSQQQWYTRDSAIGRWEGGVWNMVFSGVQGAPPQAFPNPPHTTLGTTPVSREKPYVYFENGKYSVFVPSLRRDASGASWPNTPGTSVPMSQFYVAKPGVSTDTLNQALAQGLNLLFTPGVYNIDKTINVTRANTVVMGLGYATLIPQNGVVPMRVADVDGVKLASLLFDAGTVNSPILLEVGQAGSHVNHAGNPISVQDVFFRIGGAVAGKSAVSLVVHSDHTIIDHIWAWRGDHGEGIGWTVNTADTGLIVNGNFVLATGLFVEHYQKYEVIWNGQGGKTIFFQNEKPYDPPNQDAYRGPRGNGYAAYKVADNVSTHELWGGGSYVYFNVNPGVNVARAFEVPVTPGVRLRSVLTVSLGNNGSISNVVNDTGGPVPIPGTNTSPRNVVSFP